MKVSLLLLFLMASPALAMGKSQSSQNVPPQISPAIMHTEADCGDADPLSTKSPEIQAFFSLSRNQQDFGDCFANTAADLATFATGTPISALDLDFLDQGTHETFLKRILHGRPRDSDVEEGGIQSHALNAGLKSGFCPEAIIPSSRAEGTLKGVADDLIDLTGPAKLISTIFPTLSPEKIKPNIRRLAQININDAFRALTLQACRGKRIPLTDETVVDQLWQPGTSVDTNQAIAMIDRALTENQTIAAVEIHAREITTPAVAERLNKFEGNHAVVVQGRHWSDGQCWYTIRNSWGNDCSVYNLNPASLTCDPETGIAQISENLLRYIIYNVTYLKRK